MGFIDRLQHGWNAFMNKDPTNNFRSYGSGYTYRPDRIRLSRGNERSIMTSVLNRIALDVAAIDIKHCQLDKNGRYKSDVNSCLNDCLTLEANIDQTGRAFIQDVVMSMLDEGCVAIVPVDTTFDPMITGSYDIQSIRTGKILEWKPAHVKVRVYNEKTGEKEDVIVPKSMVAIIENPLYAVINEPNSTMQRLIRKLSLLDVTDEQTASGKLDLIIQLPYTVKSETRREQVEKRRNDIISQLSNNTNNYGIAYIDSTEHITQLNRSVENNLMQQIEYLQNLLFSQLGITQSILDGTADEQTMLNYYNRSIEPIVSAIVSEMKRKFLTKTARSQMKTIAAFRDPFKLVPVNNIAEIADKFTRNEILTSNEIRQIIGMKPSNDPKADQLVNSNISQPNNSQGEQTEGDGEFPSNEMTEDGSPDDQMTEEEYLRAINDLDELDQQINELESSMDEYKDELKHYSSPYYDPVKAHEYYMKNRELKGRTSTARLNDEGKEAAQYVKKQLTTERKTKVEDHKNAKDSQIDSLKSKMKTEIESHKNVMNLKIDSLRKQLKSMNKKEKSANKERIKNEIESLREDNANKRKDLQEAFKSSRTDLNEGHKQERSRLKDEYDQKYVDELDKIRSESRYIKQTKPKASSSGKKKTSSKKSNEK